MTPAPPPPDRVLIPTKLTCPPVRASFVERPRLLSRLDEALEHRVTLVSAPPGFGKTTLAAQWLERRGVPSAWLALDPDDSDPERFVRYLVAAIQTAEEHRLPATGSLLAAREAPPFDYLAELLLAELAGLETPLVLTLEDYHALSTTDVQRLMERLVPALPPPLHLVVLTRRDPPWPLGNWRAQGWLLELRARDLRFSLEEARAFFAAGRPVPLSDPTLKILHQRAEGWIASLRLAKLSLRDAPQPEERAREFSGSDRLLIDYLIDQVLAIQPPEIREFLEATASLPRFCAPLCDHLLAPRAPQPAAAETLARLFQENLFLVPLDANGRWYRYHHLFRDLLLNHLPGLASAESRAQADRRAAEWFAREGLIEEALRHSIAAGDLGAAADLLGEHLSSVIDEDLSRRVLSRWLALFPAGAERERLPLLVAHGYARIMRWDLPGLAELLAQGGRLRRSSTSPPRQGRGPGFRADIHAQKAFLLYWSGDASEALRMASRALEDLPARTGGMAYSLAILYKAGALALEGRKDEGLRILQDAIAEAGATEGRRVGEFLFAQGALHLYAAEMAAADRSGKRMLAAHEVEAIPDYWLGYAHYLRAVVAYERNDLEEAAVGFSRVLALRYRVNSRLYQDALIGHCLTARALSQAEGVACYAAEARAYALEVGDPTSLRVADSFDARLALDTDGRTPPVSTPPAAPDFMFFWLEVPSLTYAERLVSDPSEGAGEAAPPFIEQALERVEAHHNVRQSIPFSLVRAEALARRGEQEAALAVLQATLARAEPLGLVRTFVDRGPRLRPLLETLARRNGRGGYLGTLLAACDGGEVAPSRSRSATPAEGAGPQPGEAWNVLSNREIDVLELLAERLSNKEIAVRLHVSPDTVKSHTLRIYQKLGVHGRRQAVVKAIADGLIAARA